LGTDTGQGRPYFLNLLNSITGGIERFSAQEYLSEILKVSHIYLGFSPDKNNNQTKDSQRVSLEFSESDFENFDKTL